MMRQTPVGGLCVVAACGLLAGSVGAQEDPEADPDAWEEYEEMSKEAGAGEAVPMPGDEDWGKPWKKLCPANDGWCPNIAEGVNSGVKWCKSPKCMNNHRKQSYEIWVTWNAWIEEYCGGLYGAGQPGMWPAQTMRTESFGNVFSMTKSGTEECGLASVDEAHAEKLNVNACDPQANIWATCYMRNNRLISWRKKMPEVEKAPLQDQWLIAGAGGAVGSGKVMLLLQRSGALKEDKDGNLKHAHPYEHMLRFLQTIHTKYTKGKKLAKLEKKMGISGALGQLGYSAKQGKYLKTFIDLYAKTGHWSSVFGYRPGRTAFRIARPGRVAEIIEPLYYGDIPWGEPRLPPRPAGLMDFPGKKKHCACGNWPALEHKKPPKAQKDKVTTALAVDRFPADPSTLDCEKKKSTLICDIPAKPTVYPGGG
jgi:hypothetical protein